MACPSITHSAVPRVGVHRERDRRVSEHLLDLNWPLMYAYSSSKAAVNKVMRMMSAELADDGISVVLIHPGPVKTDMGGPNAEITPEESGSGIIDVIDNTSLETTGAFMKWNGEPHNW